MSINALIDKGKRKICKHKNCSTFVVLLGPD